jgi:hypothetical protein
VAFFSTFSPMVRSLMQNNVFGHAYISVRIYHEVTAAAFHPFMASFAMHVVFRIHNDARELNPSKDFVC